MPAVGRAALRLPLRAVAFVDKQVHDVVVLARAGAVAIEAPKHTLHRVRTILRWGFSTAAGYALTAGVHPDRAAIVDELGTLTFAEVHRRTNALARELARAGIGAGDGVGVMCRNHRYFVEATVALSKLGADSLYLNTGFAGPQLAEVMEREGAKAIIHDEEFEALLAAATRGRLRFTAWGRGGEDAPALEALIAAGDTAEVTPPQSQGKVTILTSGTTGTPKGARRSQPKGLGAACGFLSRIPLRAGQRTLVAAPLFHSWGFANYELALLLADTVILQRRFDPEQTLAAIAEHRADVLVLVPVMAQRIMDLPEATRRKYDTSSLKIAGISGSALHGDLAERFMDAFGEVVYNLYGSTEVAQATIATPAELRLAPGTAGRPPKGTVVRLFDAGGGAVAPGQEGRIFVGNEFLFEGYTGGGSKAVIHGLMSTGDVGHFDRHGLLFVSGRDDEMIVSGGENVYPREVEDLLAAHPAIAEVAVVGVDDVEFGQRLRAFVVLRDGGHATAEEVKEVVRANLARYKVPRDVVFLDALPRTTTGKVLKRDLPRGDLDAGAAPSQAASG
jgi:fatty-acyl-CoA synthase